MMGNACSPGLPEYTTDNGSVTFYTLDMGSTAVNCSYDILGQNPDVIAHVATGNGHHFGAMNTADYDTAAACGACVEITRDGTKKVVITIVDQCPTPSNPKCTAGHIDLSKEAFLQIGTATEGYLGTGNGAPKGAISWRYVPCPTSEDVSFRLKEPTNQYWNQILVEGHRYAITKVEVLVNGQWVSADRQAYNYWQAGNGNMGPAPYKIRVTDVNGDVIEAQLALAAGDQVTTTQFPICQ
jgi:expansin (peptidoglycan-binding protein)